MVAPVLTPALLAQPARVGARRMALSHVRRVREEIARLQARLGSLDGHRADDAVKQTDGAVHACRVALRRLRSWLRDWGPFLRDTVREGSERRLRRMSRTTGRARDLGVQRAWLRTLRASGSARVREESRGTGRRVEAEHARALRKLARRLKKDHGRATGRLEADLRVRASGIDRTSAEPTTALAMARVLEERATRMRQVLRRVRLAGGVEKAHAARIAIRRFRYAVESLGEATPDLRLVRRSLTTMQDALGELHDSQVLAARLATSARKATTSRRPGDRGRARPRETPSALRATLRRRMASELLLVRRVLGGPELAAALAAAQRLAIRLRDLDARHSAVPAPRTPHGARGREAPG